MVDIYNSVVKELSGTIDGANKVFTTPSTYVPGTLRVIVNGQVYESDDEKYGWTEIDTLSIEMVEAPLVDDILQAFYQDAEGYTPTLDNVKGSPFHPSGALP